jgi:Uma2 family endonuclease
MLSSMPPPHPVPASLGPIRPLHRVEYDRLAELGCFEDERLELLFGTIVTVSPPGPEHSDVVCRLMTRLVVALDGRAMVRAQVPLAVSDDSEPEPDVAVVPLGDYTREHPRTARLVVEVSESSLRKDRGLKAPLYAAAGIEEYWIVDLVDRVVEVHRAPRDGRYTEVSREGRESTLRPLAFPDVAVALGDLLR